MKITRASRHLPCLLLLTLLLPAASCDWLDPSGSTSRSSPVISDLAVSPTNFLCGKAHMVRISFGYSDPQDDILQVFQKFQHARLNERHEVTIPWSQMDLDTTPGRAIAEFFVACGGPPAGDWTMTVQAEDDRGHLSNELTAEVTLLSD